MLSQSAFRRDFAEHGFWQTIEGTLLLVTPEDEVAGHVELFRPVGYWDAFELGYQLHDERFAGRGLVTEVPGLNDLSAAARRAGRRDRASRGREPGGGSP